MRLSHVVIFAFFIGSVGFAQNPGELVFEQTFDDYEAPGWTIQGTYMLDDGINDNGYNGTPGWNLFVSGGSGSVFDAQMFKNIAWDSTPTTIYRIQYRVYLETTPFEITSSLRSVDVSNLGFFYHTIVPKGFENQWFTVDYLCGPNDFYQTSRVSLQFRVGAQPEQNMRLDDIRLFAVPALASSAGFNLTTDKELNFPNGFNPAFGTLSPYNNNFELPVDNATSTGATVERVQAKDAAEGVQYLRANASSEASVAILCQNDAKYQGNYRLHLLLRSNKSAVAVRAGLADTANLTGVRRTALESLTISTANQWTEASFLIPKGSFSGNSIYAFVQFNGQGGVQMDIDRIMIFKTDEEAAALGDWELF